MVVVVVVVGDGTESGRTAQQLIDERMSEISLYKGL